jgi:hypothetical protein
MKEIEIIQRLEEFNKFAEELFELDFLKHTPKSGCTMRWEKGKGFTKLEIIGPDDQDIKAFVNDIRRFFQKGEDTLKIHKLIPIYQLDLVNNSEKKIFNRILSDLDKFNKKATNYRIGEECLTNEKIFEVFMYGRVSHRSKGTKDVHDRWEKIPPFYLLLKNEFICILHTYAILLGNVVYANKKVLERLKNAQNN